MCSGCFSFIGYKQFGLQCTEHIMSIVRPACHDLFRSAQRFCVCPPVAAANALYLRLHAGICDRLRCAGDNVRGLRCEYAAKFTVVRSMAGHKVQMVDVAARRGQIHRNKIRAVSGFETAGKL